MGLVMTERDLPEDFDELMDALPWSLRTRILRYLEGEDDEDQHDSYNQERIEMLEYFLE